MGKYVYRRLSEFQFFSVFFFFFFLLRYAHSELMLLKMNCSECEKKKDSMIGDSSADTFFFKEYFQQKRKATN